MHVLVLPSWYPHDSSDVHGSFFREQSLALRSQKLSGEKDKIGVIYPTLLSLRKLFRDKKEKRKGLVFEEDKGLVTVRFVEYDFFSKFPKLRALRWKLLGHRLFKEYIHKFGKPDLIHAHSILYGGVLANQIFQKYGIPFIVTEHASGYSLNKYDVKQLKLASITIKNARKCLAVSPTLSSDLVKIFNDSDHKWEVIPNFISSDFQSVRLIKNPIKENKFIFLSVALLTENKSIDTLLRAFSRASSKYNNFVLKIGGDGPEKLYLEKLAKQLNINDKVFFLGKLDRLRVIDEMLDANVFTLSSRYETFGVVAVEAMACGLPVISTRCGGPESIVNDRNGLLVPTQDEDAFARAMILAYENYNSFDSQLIRRECLASYSAEVVTERIMQIYRESVRESN